MKLIGELIEMISGRAGLSNVREVGETLAKSGRGRSLLDVVGSDLLDFGQCVIAGMKSTTGEGDPDRGDLFGQGQSKFEDVSGTLQSAFPNNSWDGSGAHTYADQNTRQQLRSETMAGADHEVHRVLFREAAQITLRRGYLDDQSNFLANTSRMTFPLQFIPRYGEAAKLAIEIAALQTALGESAYQMHQLQSEVANNAAELEQAVGRYSGVPDGAELPGAGVNFDPPPQPAGGSSPTGPIPIERSQEKVAQRGIAVPSDPPAGVVSSPVTTAGSQPTLPDLPPVPPLPQAPAVAEPAAPGAGVGAGPLGSLMSPLGGLQTGAAQAAGQRTSVDKKSKGESGRPGGEDEPKDTEDVKDAGKATSGDGGSERAPIHVEVDFGPDRLHAPVTVRLEPDNPPGPPRGTPPQGKR